MKALILFVLSMLLFSNISFAHPGRTDQYGGHVCRTNCEDWGLSYGEYHYHNSYTSPQKDNDENIWENIIFWGVIIFAVVGWIIYKIKQNGYYYRPRIDVTPKENGPQKISVTHVKTLIPPDEEVELIGIITDTRVRKNGFYVSRFRSIDDGIHTIVGVYHGRLYKNKQCTIKGTKTYDRRYGMQIRLKNSVIQKISQPMENIKVNFMIWIYFFIECALIYTIFKLIIWLLSLKNISLSDKKKYVVGLIIAAIVFGTAYFYDEQNSIKDGQQYYVNLFPKLDSQKNYRVPALIYTDEDGITISVVYWSNGGETTFYNSYEKLIPGEKVEIKDDEGKEWFIEMTKERVEKR